MHVEAVDQKPVRSWIVRPKRLHSEAAVENVIPSDLALSADENGSPAKVDAADWIVCFVPGLRPQWWHPLVNYKHKHVFAMRPTNNGSWLLMEPWWTRMMVTVLSPADAVKFLRWGAAGDMLRVREAIPGKASQFRGWSNCAVLTAFVLGRSSRTWTPHGLYQELIREQDVTPAGVEQLLVAQFRDVSSQYLSIVLAFGADELSLPLEGLLFLVGRYVLQTIMSPALLELCRIAVLEGRRFPALAEAYADHAAARAIALLTEILETADQNGEIELEDHEAGARQFLAMLCGKSNLEPVLRAGSIPTRSEIDGRARVAVDDFLGGISADRREECSAPPTGSQILSDDVAAYQVNV